MRLGRTLRGGGVLGDFGRRRRGAIAENLRASVHQQAIPFTGGEVALTVSIGVAIHKGHPDCAQLLDRADGALYEAKRQGRDRVMVGSFSLTVRA
ncbi:MAG: hypothetical protein COX57_05015 [Alphaproteobacteria bacterium CG_4_10_14_0_2_um_filter_63_37]|nr:MAG: hypothetical protein COX57_05015 [Alphaproteobacteria bacterium CG_4_10_14_0_2_um_filter_63_37]